MGNKQSNISEKTSITDIVSKNMLNSFTRNLNEQNSRCNAIQYAEITSGPGSEINCAIDLNQKATLNCQAQAYFKSQNENLLKADIKNSLDQSFKSDQQQENPSFTLVPYSQQDSQDRTNVQNYIKNIVERNLTSENLNKCLAIAKGAQDGKITILGKVNCPPGKNSISINQEMLLQQYAQCGSDIVNKTLTDDKFINDLKVKAESSQSNLTSGYGAIIVLIVILIFVGAFLYFRFGGAKMMAASSPTQYQSSPPPNITISPF